MVQKENTKLFIHKSDVLARRQIHDKQIHWWSPENNRKTICYWFRSNQGRYYLQYGDKEVEGKIYYLESYLFWCHHRSLFLTYVLLKLLEVIGSKRPTLRACDGESVIGVDAWSYFIKPLSGNHFSQTWSEKLPMSTWIGQSRCCIFQAKETSDVISWYRPHFLFLSKAMLWLSPLLCHESLANDFFGP